MERKIVGYVLVNPPERVETAQEIEQQAERLEEQGATEIFIDIGSGLDRSDFILMMNAVLAGEVQEVVVTGVDRLTRSLANLNQIIDFFHNSGVNLRILDQQIDLRTPTGKLMMRLLGLMGEWEHDLLNQKSQGSS